MGFLPLSVSLFPVGLPQRPTPVQMDAGESSCEGERAQMFDFIPNLFVCSYVRVACLSQNFLSFFTQFVQVNLLKSKLHLSVLGLPPWSLSRATALILHYSAYLLRPCVYVQLCTRFPLTLGSEKLQLLWPVPWNRPLPCLNICQLQHCLSWLKWTSVLKSKWDQGMRLWPQTETNTYLHTLSVAFRENKFS